MSIHVGYLAVAVLLVLAYLYWQRQRGGATANA